MGGIIYRWRWGLYFARRDFTCHLLKKPGFINGNAEKKSCFSSVCPCRAEIMGVALSSCSPVKISGTRRALPDSEGPLQMFCLARRNSLSKKPPHVGPCQAGRTQPVISDSPKCHRRTPLFIFTLRISFLVFRFFWSSATFLQNSVTAVEGSLPPRITRA